jgi:hypothetical protein
MNRSKLLLIAALGLVVWLAGCKVKDPGSASADTPPTTIISVAPQDSAIVNHYINLRWAGNDPDGSVTGYRIFVDDVLISITTATDTSIAFTATLTGVPTPHSFSVQAVDNAGLVDPHPPIRHFYVINYAPVIHLVTSGSVPNGSTVGTAFRLTVSASDTNPSLMLYSMSLDNQTSWTTPTADSVFIYADPALIGDPVLFPSDAYGLDNSSLTAGWHTAYFRVEDAGHAYSNVVSDSFRVELGVRPAVNPGFTSQYGGSEFYPDGSVYYSNQSGVSTTIEFTASAASYHGEINAYRYRVRSMIPPATEFGPFGDWSGWALHGAVDTADLRPGQHEFQLMARDLAGAFSDTLVFVARLVQQHLSDSVIIVSETRDGPGIPGAPRAATVDTFYAHIFDGAKYRFVRYTNVDLDPSAPRAGEYISPYDVRNAGLIMWCSDDRADIRLNLDSVSVRLMRNFLALGGRVIISGWDVMKYLGSSTSADTLTFGSGSFSREELRLFHAYRVRTRTTLGFEGTNGFPSCYLDSTKLAVPFHGKLDYSWVFHPRGEDVTVGLEATSDSTANIFYHLPSAYVYDQSFRVAVFGIPLYFCYENQVRALFWNAADPTHGIIQRMLEGLTP